MENKAHAMAAGIFVVVVAALLVMLASWLARESGVRDPYEISTHDSVSGLQAQAAVRLRGVDVGKVAALGFDPKVQGNVLVRLEIDRDAPVTKNTYATLSYQGVTGIAFVELDDNGEPAPRLQPEDGQPPRIPLKPGLLQKLADRGEQLLDRADQAIGRINQMVGDANQKRVATALDNLGNAAGHAGELAQDLDTTLKQRVDPALAEATGALRSVRSSFDEFGRAARRLNAPDGPVDRLAQGTEALSHAADSFNAATLPRVNRVAEDTSRAVRQLGRTATTIGDNPQSLIYGSGPIAPGPGEPGFVPPGGQP